MRILFDYQAFEMQRIGGVSRSYAELISSLQRNDYCSCKVGIKESDNLYLKEYGITETVKPLHYTHNCLFQGKKLFIGQRKIIRGVLGLLGHHNGGLDINKEYCQKLLKRQSFDIFEPTFFNSYFLPYLKDKPFVLTVHDMIPELFPQFFHRDDFQIRQKKILCPLATHIHVPSNKTKEDLIDILNVNPEKITVIPHGGPQDLNSSEGYKKLFDFPYLLYVGDRYGYKNFQPWLKSVVRVIRDHPEIHIICTGKPFNDAEQRLINELHLDSNVIHYFADQSTFGSLYHNAIAFVFPSGYEGFGLPILEAFAYECPVMLNHASCFPEVGGDAVVYFSITDERSDFYDKFQYVYSMGTEDRRRLINKGKDRLSLFSWENASKQLMNIYSSI